MTNTGTKSRCTPAATITCTKCGVEQPFGSLRNVRPWPGAGLEIGECQQSYGDVVCNSTLARDVEEVLS